MKIITEERVVVEREIAYMDIMVPNDEVCDDDHYTGDGRFPEKFVYPDGSLNIRVDLHTGRIVNWPSGHTVDAYFNPRDSGRYALIDPDFKPVRVIDDDYVPSCLDMNDGGDDYLALKVSGDGTIDGFTDACTSYAITQSFWRE